MKILLTGATGFLGSRLTRRLLDNTDHEPTLLVRPGRERQLPESSRIAVCPGDITDRASVERALEGCRALIHTAAKVSVWARDRSEFERVNVDGTLELFDCAVRAGVDRIIYVSSFLALGFSTGPLLNEDGPHEREIHFNDYERTKYLADRAATELAGQGAPIVTLYPGVIYGPGQLTEGNLIVNLLIDYMTGKLPARIGHGRQRWNFVFVEDVVSGILLALKKAAPGSRYILGGENLSLNEFFSAVEKTTGIPQPAMSVPFGPAKALGALEEAAAFLFGRMPRTTRGVVDIFRRNWVFDSGRAERELGYTHRGLIEGLRTTVEWLRRDVLAGDGSGEGL